jgi:hypothetical protein
MNAQPPTKTLTDGEREILFQMQQLQAKWADTVEMCLNHMLTLRGRVEELTAEVKELREQLSKDRLF